ncbi:MAG: recombination mediator RecR [Anaerolineales bacterium]
MSAAVPQPVERLIEALARLPGIGPKTASRLTYYLLKAPESESLELAQAVEAMRTGTVLCSTCFNITVAEENPCSLCTDRNRQGELLCVVEAPLDVLAIERTGMYKGHYHVLHGAISPVEGVGPEDLKINELVVRVEKEGVRELILATNPTLEGEATAMYLRRQFEGSEVKITRLARGLPSGGDLEYADVTTLSQALEGRQEVS